MRKLLLILGLALCAWPCFGQQVLPINSGVVIANMQNGTTFFKVSLTANVTSLSIIGQQANVTSATIIFQQDNTGGRTVTFASNITGCTVTGTANASTVCVFTYDPGTASWFGTGGGSVSLPTTLSAPGVFTGTQMNESFVTSINSCMPSNGSSPAFVTDALTGCVSVPSSGVSNGFSNGVAGYAFNGNACTTCSGYGGPAGAVGVFGKGWATANNGHVWGLDTTSGNDVGTSGNMVFGYEADVYSQGTTPTGAGILLSLRGTTQSTAFPAIDIQTPQSTALWTNALQVDTGAVSSSGDALQVSPFATSAGSNSPPIALIGVNSSGTQQQVFLQARGSTPAAGNLPLVALLIGSFGTSPQTSTVLSFGGATGLGAGTLILSGPLSLPTFTVSTLPSASTAGAGAMVRVSDASTFTVGTCTGGGSDLRT